jgi:polysaccharide pyruvyl transferase WcaK-like protein
MCDGSVDDASPKNAMNHKCPTCPRPGGPAGAHQSGIAPGEVLILGGYGFGNTGDEAQLNANLVRWRDSGAHLDVVVLSPNPNYTSKHHKCRSALASRVIFFRSNVTVHYNHSDRRFRFAFWLTLIRMELNARLMRAGLSPWLATSQESRFLGRLQSATAIHVSGGGFMTGPTRSRLWDTCLVLRICSRLNVPYFLTGQTLGLFQNSRDRWLARTALQKAVGISLRDPEASRDELIEVGVAAEKLVSSYDDALFCETADRNDTVTVLAHSGAVPEREYLAVNYHWWGMDEETRVRSAKHLAATLDKVVDTNGLQIIFVPMIKGDVKPQRAVADKMDNSAVLLDYDYTFPMARSVIAGGFALLSFKHHPLIFAMGETTPCIGISFDPYYYRKNVGAMANLGMERFCLDRGEFFGQRCADAIQELFNNHHEIVDVLKSRLPLARETQDQFFSGMLRKLKLLPQSQKDRNCSTASVTSKV